ncbi:MAG: type 1 glutamine amidotransferase domain-containing protein [Phycisphaeraceae bacterium]
MQPLQGKRVLIFVGSDYEDMELQYPKYRLREAGAEVVVAGQEKGATYLGKHGYPQKSEAAVSELAASDFHALVVPGGWMPDKLRRDEDVKRLTREIHEAGKPVASICHGGWIDISAGIIEQGQRYTSTPGIRDDLVNAGGEWVDEAVVVSKNRVTSRRPDDLPAFCSALIEMLAGVGAEA